MYTRIMEISPWTLRLARLGKERRRLQESLTSLGNGYIGMRGSFEETYSADSHLGTCVAGVWFPDKIRIGWWKNGYPKYFGKAIDALNFSKVRIFVDRQEVDLARNDVAGFSAEFDMQHGVLHRSLTVFGVRFDVCKFLSVAQKELAVICWEAVFVDGKTHQVHIDSIIDADVGNEDSNYKEKLWQVLDKGVSDDRSYIATQTVANPFSVERFTVNAERTFAGSFKALDGSQIDRQISSSFEAEVGGTPEILEKRVIVTTSRDYQSLKAVKAAGRALSEEIVGAAFETLLDVHKAGWLHRWEIADVVIEGSDEAQQGIRFNLFQLFSTYYGEDARLNTGPKGFTGEKYGDATYWDTEAYAAPLYLALAGPEVTRNLLQYRRNQLPQAQHNAREQGLADALYPMVTFTGIGCHSEWKITFGGIHRSGTIPYAIYNYTNYIGDEGYLVKEDLEVLVEVSRFWMDRVHFSERNGKYMIHGVTGPDEYENNINNGWHISTLVAWVLDYTREALMKYLRPNLNVSAAELEKWADIDANIYRPHDEEPGVFVQHDGFPDKDIRPASALSSNDLSLNQKWSWGKILCSPFIKQADVSQGICFFGDRFNIDERRRNFDFYEPITVHESSLSPCIHAILAVELGKEEKAVEMYQRAARLDLGNYNNGTEDSLHITPMTGSWLAIVQGFAQTKAWGGKLSFAPFLPSAWTGYAFHINYRGRLIKVAVGKESVIFTLPKGGLLELQVYGKDITLNGSYTVTLNK